MGLGAATTVARGLLRNDVWHFDKLEDPRIFQRPRSYRALGPNPYRCKYDLHQVDGRQSCVTDVTDIVRILSLAFALQAIPPLRSAIPAS